MKDMPKERKNPKKEEEDGREKNGRYQFFVTGCWQIFEDCPNAPSSMQKESQEEGPEEGLEKGKEKERKKKKKRKKTFGLACDWL